MKILVTGFEPFDNESMNPAYEAVSGLPHMIDGAEIIKKQLPVVFNKAGEMVQQFMRKLHPDMVLLVGMWGGRTAMSVERIAINMQSCQIGFNDNDGNCPQDKKVVEDGPDGIFSNLPVRAMVDRMTENGVPAFLSNTAGVFVCNDIMYHALYLQRTECQNMKVGFVHVPYAVKQNHPFSASMPLAEITRGGKLCIEAMVGEACYSDHPIWTKSD